MLSPTLAIAFFLYLLFVIFFIVLGNKHPNKHEMRALGNGDLTSDGAHLSLSPLALCIVHQKNGHSGMS